MSLEDRSAAAGPCLLLIRPEPQGQFTAQLVGLDDLHVTAPSREEAVAGVRSLLREWIEAGKLLRIDSAAGSALMDWFGHARDDPDFGDYLEEIRRRREDADHPIHGEPPKSG
jgi:hypothetical protein